MFSLYGYIIIEFLIFVIAPIILMKKYTSVLNRRHAILLAGMVYVLFIASSLELPSLHTSFKSPDSIIMIVFTIIPSLVINVIVYMIHKKYPDAIVDIKRIVRFWKLPYYTPLILYPVLSVPLQEILFRWFYINRLLTTSLSEGAIILLSACVFGILHIPFGKPLLALSTFILALWWNTLYLITGNLWYPIVAHSLCGNMLIWIALYGKFCSPKSFTRRICISHLNAS